MVIIDNILCFTVTGFVSSPFRHPLSYYLKCRSQGVHAGLPLGAELLYGALFFSAGNSIVLINDKKIKIHFDIGSWLALSLSWCLWRSARFHPLSWRYKIKKPGTLILQYIPRDMRVVPFVCRGCVTNRHLVAIHIPKFCRIDFQANAVSVKLIDRGGFDNWDTTINWRRWPPPPLDLKT